MDKKVLFAAASAITIFGSACSYNPRTGTAGMSAVTPPRTVRMSASAPVMPNTTLNYRPYPSTAIGTRMTANNPNYVKSTTSAGLGSLCEKIYSTAQSGNWAACNNNVNSLKAEWSKVHNTILAPATQNSRRAAVNNTLKQLTAAVTAKNPLSTQKSANKLYKDFADISSLYNPSKTANIKSMRYYSREIIQDCNAKNLTAAKANCAKLVQSWNNAKNLAASKQTQDLVNAVNRSVGNKNLAKTKTYCSDLLTKSGMLESEMLSRNL